MRAFRLIAGLLLLAALGFAAFFYYSWGWSERFLAPIRVGMSTIQVQRLVGPPPDVRRNSGLETWDYTRFWSRDARVYFDTNGVVWAVETD
jgi:hypothetical protein